MFWHLGFADPGETAPPSARQFLEMVKDSPAGAPLLCKPTSPKLGPPTTFTSSCTLVLSPPALITPGTGNRYPGTAPVPQNPLKLFKVAHPKPAYPALPTSSYGNQNKDSCPHFPLTPSASQPVLVLPIGAPKWRVMPSISRDRWLSTTPLWQCSLCLQVLYLI